jgi:hypothetical protein
VLSLLLALLVPVAPALAVPDDTPGEGPSEGPCALSAYDFKLEGNFVVVGAPVAGSPIKIDASSAKLVGRKATQARICDLVLFPVSRFSWSVVAAPAGQSASIADAGTLAPSVNLGGPGAYRVRFTACPSGCRVTLNGRSRTIGAATREVAINASSSFQPPPESEPLLPTLSPPANPPPRFTEDERDKACLGGGGVVDPQWVTAEPFRGPEDYRTVEGKVEVSKVSRQDNFLNHDSQDLNWDVRPDPPSFGFGYPSINSSMEMEWERDSYPREFRPTAGDRASTVGYWILDCGHDGFLGEIHPPVGTMVHRPRAVTIPSSFRPAGFPNGMGGNVQVPGIATDIWFNRKAGEITNNCSDTGLHQPPRRVTLPNGSSANVAGPCVREPSSLNRRFTFNIYLPRDPLVRARELGLNPPAVPLFVGFEGRPGGSGGPDPTFVVRRQGNATWLEATVDLRGFTGTTYARRVNAAWAYPNPTNWDAKRWRLRLNKIHVYDDAEPAFDDGDWRFFANINNRDREWTTVIDCDGCIDDDDDRTLNFSTGPPGVRSLGSDLVLFPGQRVAVHTGGFDDETFGDDIGTVFDRRPQQAASYSTDSAGGDGAYRLDYAISAGPAVGAPQLTPEGNALAAAYTKTSTPPCRLPVLSPSAVLPPGVIERVCGPVAPLAQDPTLIQPVDLGSLVLKRKPKVGDDLELFESEEEEFVLPGIPVSALERLLTRLRAKEPRRYRAFLADIRRELGELPAKRRANYSDLVAGLDKALPKKDANSALPSGLRKALKPFVVERGERARERD